MTIKEARKQVSEAGFTVQREGEDLLLWGYSPQGAPSSRLFFRLKNTSGLRDIATCAQRIRSEDAGYKSPYQKQVAISNLWYREY